MTAYAAQRYAKRTRWGQHRRHRQPPAAQEQWHSADQALRCSRRQQRWARRTTDAAWRAAKQAHAAHSRPWRRLPRAEQGAQAAAHQAEQAQWQAQVAARQADLAQRQGENATWQAARAALREQQAQLQPVAPPSTAWLAILVIIDNCTRCCLGLAQFSAGAHVSAEELIQALRPLLPAGLQFLISDNGSQFTASAFAALAQQAHFVHVRIAPRRPCTNGIAERFVHSLKDLLTPSAWHSADELAALLPSCRAFYNERPHQGVELQGLSPNEYARRLRLGATC